MKTYHIKYFNFLRNMGDKSRQIKKREKREKIEKREKREKKRKKRGNTRKVE